jgi:hypothetical protein
MAAKRLLRHSSVITTQERYIKEMPETTLSAMKKVEALCNDRARDPQARSSEPIEKFGAGGETRTLDLGIMRPSLYP